MYKSAHGKPPDFFFRSKKHHRFEINFGVNTEKIIHKRTANAEPYAAPLMKYYYCIKKFCVCQAFGVNISEKFKNDIFQNKTEFFRPSILLSRKSSPFFVA